MRIETRRLVLVPHGTAFLESTHVYASDPVNTRFMMHLPNDDLAETKAFLDMVDAEWKKPRPEFYEFAILLDGVHIGAISLYHDKAMAEAELGWILHKNYWGQGYVLEAAHALITIMKTDLELKRCIAHCDAENLASARVMQKLGMNFVSRSGGRRNKLSNEEREELIYAIDL